jgi:glutamate synthase (NADPH/NADH) small chain
VAATGGAPASITAAGKHVIVIGGGDTGADCVGNSHREGAASVTQIELLGEPPASRPDDLTPWPRWPMKYRRSYAIKEGGEQDFSISTTKLTGNGRVERIHWMQNTGKPPFAPVPGTEESQPADLVLLAMGFLHPEGELLDALGVEKDPRGNAKAGTYATSADGVYAAGDARRGQSLIVWAIAEGRACAAAVDELGRTDRFLILLFLPLLLIDFGPQASAPTHNRPGRWRRFGRRYGPSRRFPPCGS